MLAIIVVLCYLVLFFIVVLFYLVLFFIAVLFYFFFISLFHHNFVANDSQLWSTVGIRLEQELEFKYCNAPKKFSGK